MVRLGRHGEQEAHALATSDLTIGFKVGDLRGAKDRDAILKLLFLNSPDGSRKTLLNFAAQLNQFCNEMKIGDLVVVPLKTTRQMAIGKIVGDLTLIDGRPSRKVNWLKTDLPRSAFKQDLLFSFGAAMTVCEIKRNDALRRVEVAAKKGIDPGYETAITIVEPGHVADIDADSANSDLAEIARDQIERRIASTFVGHDLTRLVAAILTAQGYLVNVSPPGPDKGIDIVAGRGPSGFEPPRLVVQVKSGNAQADQPTLQSLIGAVQDTHADQGLLVCWSGFKSTVESRKNELFFRIRLWGRVEIIDNLLNAYDKLPEEIRAELPLQQIWTLVLTEQEE
jgi:restriction system protein